MMQFSMQIQNNIPSFTAFEMFEIDGTLIYGVLFRIYHQFSIVNVFVSLLYLQIVSATTTYLIILVQYSTNNPEVSHGHNHTQQYHHHPDNYTDPSHLQHQT